MHLKWDQTLPISLLLLKVAPRSELKLSPFEIIYVTLPNIGFGSTFPPKFGAQVKNYAIYATFRANANHFTQVC